jgi:sialate O-acetylesterase
VNLHSYASFLGEESDYNSDMPINLLATAVSLSAMGQAPALPFVAPIFSSNMVLQRDMNDPIWGWTSPGSKVMVTIDGKTASATADSTGKWMTKLPRFKAGGDYELSVSGPSSATFTNVTFGDVWICSGQSNMEFGVGNLLNPAQVISEANYPNLRLYAQPKLIAYTPTEGVGASWEVCTPANLQSDGDWNGFSAVAYFFGRKLNQDLNVPIGLLHTSWGGTIAEAWTPKAWLQKYLPEFDPAIAAVEEEGKSVAGLTPEKIAQEYRDWYQKYDPGSKEGQSWADPSYDDSSWHATQVPGYFQKSGFPEFNNNTSVVWYRKEIDIPADVASKATVLHFYADDNDKTFLNGAPIGETEGATAARNYAIPAGTLHEGKNVLAVRVTDTGAPGGIYGLPETLYLAVDGAPQISLAGDWKIKLGTVIDQSNPLPQILGTNPNLPTVLYNGMIEPLTPFAVKGAIWYQGESNVGRAKQYQTLLPTMIQSWREAFHSGNFPFLIVQLAGFQHPPLQPGDDAWAELRDAQFIASKAVPNGGIATAIDIGEENDIHPKNKLEISRRLALVAEADVYGKHVVASGPRFKSDRVEGSSIEVSFEDAKGLKTSDGEAVKGFAIAGDDKEWHWADAKIEGDRIIVSSPQVAHPAYVRYAWATFLPLNLQNGAGLPAFPFRTDQFPIH